MNFEEPLLRRRKTPSQKKRKKEEWEGKNNMELSSLYLLGQNCITMAFAILLFFFSLSPSFFFLGMYLVKYTRTHCKGYKPFFSSSPSFFSYFFLHEKKITSFLPLFPYRYAWS